VDPLLDDASDAGDESSAGVTGEPSEQSAGPAPEADVETDQGVTPDAGDYRVMSVETVLFDLSDPSPHVHLMEQELPYRGLSIPVALPDAQAIHAALENVRGRRPTTHELLCEIVARLRCDVVAARIVRLDQGVYHAQLDLMTPRGVMHVDCRTSDALVVALRQPVVAPILCAEEVLVAAQS
jgi:bifunctional DNase/RNase